jgi:hypothetical protein
MEEEEEVEEEVVVVMRWDERRTQECQTEVLSEEEWILWLRLRN